MIIAFIFFLVYALPHIRVSPGTDKRHTANNYQLYSAKINNGPSAEQQNQIPVVKINSPKQGGMYEWNTTTPYSISVSDKEDGDSKFEEITPNEVLLEVKYFKDSSKIAAALHQPAKKDAAGITVIKTSNCLNCHAFHAILIGPSFYDVSKRYPPSVVNIDLLTKHIREGSSGVWGKVVMPTHPELSVPQTKEVVKWILANAGKPDMNYFMGTEGSFRLQPPASVKNKGFLMLTASYTDHGFKRAG